MAAEPSRGRATQVERTSPREAEAARALFERHSGQLYAFCLHRLGSREEAEDAVQTTFLNAFRGLQRGVVPEAEAAWLFKIAENVCLTRRRSAWRRGRVESPSDMQVLQEVTPARQTDRGDELIPLGDALAAMPETQRRAILLREWQGLSYKEISDEMNVSQSAVETLIFRARRSLANALETPWEARRSAGGHAGRAFNVASLLAWLKTLFAGGTAAKVAVVAVAATGTAALAVADSHQPVTPKRGESPQAVSGVEGLDIARDEQIDRAERAFGGDGSRALQFATAGREPKGLQGEAAATATNEPADGGVVDGAAAKPDRAGERGASGSEHRGNGRAGSKMKAKKKAKTKRKPAKARGRGAPKPRSAPAAPRPSGGNRTTPQASAQKPAKPTAPPPATAPPPPAPPPPPPPSPPPEKDKEKGKSE